MTRKHVITNEEIDAVTKRKVLTKSERDRNDKIIDKIFKKNNRLLSALAK